MSPVIYRILLNILEYWFFWGGNPWHNAVFWHCCYVRVAGGAAQQSRNFMFCSLCLLIGWRSFFDKRKFPLCCTTDQFTSRVWRGERLCVFIKSSSNLPPCLFFKKKKQHNTLNIQMCGNGNTEY